MMTQKDNGQDYMDPILTPGNLRKFVENLPGKAKHQHSDYQYNSDSDIFEHEINEFFTYTEVAVQLQEYRRLFEKEYSEKKKAYQITQLLDGMEYEDEELRLQACKHVVYFALGCFTTDPNETKQQRMDRLIDNCNKLIIHGAFHLIFQKLQQSSNAYLINSQKNTVAIYTEIDLYMTVLYLLVESQRHQSSFESCQKFKQEFVTLEPNLTEFLLLLTSKLRERLPDKSFPTRKTVLLLWKSILFISGGLESIQSSAESLRKSLGIPTKASIITKCTPQEVHLFQQEITQKYPGYTPPNLPLQAANPLTIQASPSLATALGYSNAIEHVDLLYHTLFPPKSLTNATKNKQQQHHLLQNYFPSSPSVSPAFPLPLSHTSGSDVVPQSIQEAGNVYLANLHVSLSNYQLLQERSNGIQHWQNKSKSTQDNKNTTEKGDDVQRWMERLYANMLPELQNVIVVLLKLLLTSVSPNTNNKHSGENNGNESTSDKTDDNKATQGWEDAVTLEYLEEADTKRNREVISKAISGLVFLLLKWSKSSHVLKYECISQLLADSGCMLLILKMIGLQEVTDMVTAHTDVPYYSFFDYNVNRPATTDHHQDIAEMEAGGGGGGSLYTNRRNMYWSINFLRILQMLSKHKPHRIMLLVQYKSAAILKRLLKIAHPVLEQYVLKLLKSQVPYLGRKWKSQNMRIISSIYLNCKTVLQDDWICKTSADEDVELGKMEEQHLRILTRIYNGKRYMPSFLPPHDEVYSETNSSPSGPGFNGFQDYNLDASIDYDSIDLEPDFISNYNAWLETEVFNTEDDDQEEEEPIMHPKLGNETPIPSTPYPSNNNNQQHFTPEELTFEINKLYVQELNAEFKPATPLTITEVKNPNEAWDSPPTPKKLTPLFRYDGNERSMTYLRPQEKEEEQKDEQWQMQTRDQLLSRLFLIEEKAAEKWLAQDGKHAALYHYPLFDDLFEQDVYASSSEWSNHTSSSMSDDDYLLQDTTPSYDDDDHY